MPAKVVDASVLAAWCFGEPRAQEALGLIQNSDLYASSLLAYELASIAKRKAAAYPQSLSALVVALQTALASYPLARCTPCSSIMSGCGQRPHYL